MLTIKRSLLIAFSAVCTLTLSGCGGDWYAHHSGGQSSDKRYNYNNYQNVHSRDGGSGYQGGYRVRRGVHVPQSPHVSAGSSPVSHKARDKNWVQNQDGQGYTVEVSTGDKASSVARTLHTVPSDQRKAQLKYQKDGKTMHRGLYGTYKTKEEAQAAVNKLPENVRGKAKVKQWNNVKPAESNSSDE